MLPAAAAFHFPWEVSTGSVQEGKSVRTFGRDTTSELRDHGNPSLTNLNPGGLFRFGAFGTGLMGSGHGKIYKLVCYQPEESRATLSAQHASKEHHVVVHTMFVEPFNPIIGAQYIALGETEHSEGVGHMVRARVLNCVDGVNIALLQKAINEQRSFLRERECEQGKADAT